MKKIIAIVLTSIMCSAQILAIPTSVIPIGQTTGVKLMCDGIIVSGSTRIITANGPKYPANDAGLKNGDIIETVDGIKITNNEQMASVINSTNGKTVDVTYLRDGYHKQTTITPVQDVSDNLYKIGIWIKDSVAGIGTITYIDPETGIYGSLGHSISDGDTGSLITVGDGQIVPSTVKSVQKGEAGAPGQLQGQFDANINIGDIQTNTEQGIFGVIDDNIYSTKNSIDVADIDEVLVGDATILTNINGDLIEEYRVKIVDIKSNTDENRNFIIEITDKELIAQTGGIVQGMSGSPILQNGKIIGAITHVFVNDPTKGYGIYIGNMLETAEEITTK